MSFGKIVILGSNHRGLWLAQELVKSKFDVTWMEIEKGYEPSLLDDFVWQVGTRSEFKKLPVSAQEFSEECFGIEEQESLQIITPRGPLDLGGPLSKSALKFYFGSSADSLEQYWESIGSGSEKLISAYEKKILDLNYAQRWAAQWTTALRTSVSPRAGLLGNEPRLNPNEPYFLTKNSMTKARQTAMEKVSKAGVKVLGNSTILDIARDGNRITGIENEESRGFVSCDELVLACSAEHIEKKIPEFSKKMKAVQENSKPAQFVWLRFGFKMKARSKPEGLYEFSSFVMDPLMPLEGSQFGILRWAPTEKNDIVTVWSRILFEDTKKQSTLEILADEVRTNLSLLFPKFEECFILTIAPQIQISADNATYIYPADRKVYRDLYKKNLWLAGIATDYSANLTSAMETEFRIYKGILNKYRKEFKGDRALHQTKHGASLGH